MLDETTRHRFAKDSPWSCAIISSPPALSRVMSICAPSWPDVAVA